MHRELGLSTLSLFRTPWQSRGFLRGDGFGACHAPCCARSQMPRAFPTLFSGRFLPLPAAGSTTGDAVRQPQQSTPRTRRCPTCRAPRAGPTPGSRDGAAHGAWQGLPQLWGGTRGQGTPPPLTPAPSSPLQSLAPTLHPHRAPVPEPSRRSSRDCGTWRAAPPLDTSPPCPSCLTRPPCCKDALHLGGGGWIVPGGPRTPQGCPMAPGVATDPRHWAGLWEGGPSSFGVGG